MNNSLLSFTHEELTRLGASDTAKEIAQQPDMWLKTYNLIKDKRSNISGFVSKALGHPDTEIILTGAGSSAFIAEIITGAFQKYTGKLTRAIRATELVTHPFAFLQPGKVVLLVSFARSGNSPESLAVVTQAEKICKKVYHLIITCNKNGVLAQNARSLDCSLIVLPSETNDQSLVMTSSFTSMAVAGLLVARINHIDKIRTQIERLALYGQMLLTTHLQCLREVASQTFTRAVFLGSGCTYSIAKESQLKLIELTGGYVMGYSDSFLGFRHGPKAMIDANTLIVYLFSNEKYAYAYEKDLVKAVNEGERGKVSLGIAENSSPEGIDQVLLLSVDDGKLDEDLFLICQVLPAQIIGFFKSIECELNPDMPSKSGTITREVKGVNIYPFDFQESRIESVAVI